MATQLPPPMVIYQLASAHYISQALYVAAHLGIADLLAEGPQTPEALAAKTGTHAGSLRRVLRLLASAGVFAEDADGRFELTPVGSALRSGPDSSQAANLAEASRQVMLWRRAIVAPRSGWSRTLDRGSRSRQDHSRRPASIAAARRSIPRLAASGRTAPKPSTRLLVPRVRPTKYADNGVASTPR